MGGCGRCSASELAIISSTWARSQRTGFHGAASLDASARMQGRGTCTRVPHEEPQWPMGPPAHLLDRRGQQGGRDAAELRVRVRRRRPQRAGSLARVLQVRVHRGGCRRRLRQQRRRRRGRKGGLLLQRLQRRLQLGRARKAVGCEGRQRGGHQRGAPRRGQHGLRGGSRQEVRIHALLLRGLRHVHLLHRLQRLLLVRLRGVQHVLLLLLLGHQRGLLLRLRYVQHLLLLLLLHMQLRRLQRQRRRGRARRRIVRLHLRGTRLPR